MMRGPGAQADLIKGIRNAAYCVRPGRRRALADLIKKDQERALLRAARAAARAGGFN